MVVKKIVRKEITDVLEELSLLTFLDVSFVDVCRNLARNSSIFECASFNYILYK